MGMSQYWVGQKPSHPVTIDVRDSSNARVNLSGFDTIRLKLIGSDNEDVSTEGVLLSPASLSQGRLVLTWPTDRSLFEKAGDYLLQLELIDGDYVDYTTVHDIRVHKLGGTR